MRTLTITMATTTTAVLALLASATLAAAAPAPKNAAQACKAEQKENAALFAEAYKAQAGSKKKPFATCIQVKKVQAQALQDATKNAAKACKAERAADASAFAEKYGTNKNKKNAFGKCVSSMAKELRDEVAEEAQDARSAACKALRKNQPADFAKAYRNLGACIKAQPKS